MASRGVRGRGQREGRGHGEASTAPVREDITQPQQSSHRTDGNGALDTATARLLAQQ